MLVAVILVPLASLLWGITNHIDKHLISKISKNCDFKGLIVFSSLVAGSILFPISLIISNFKVGISLLSFILIFFSCFYVFNSNRFLF